MLANRFIMQKIKIGEIQPVECDRCQAKEGYQYSDYISLHYTTFHDSEGKHEGGQYSEGCKQLTKAITPYCLNCGERLSFKLIRETFEKSAMHYTTCYVLWRNSTC